MENKQDIVYTVAESEVIMKLSISRKISNNQGERALAQVLFDTEHFIQILNT